ncbi:helix-turn-helix domain-containing protein [Hathewaya massiliensis]|uniref:helix-turn-helix domain-containing protein n=1 Tax=Hathewaya massiliensis TaxID=1964382 RepID=UPI00115B3D48|nr:helix-turn-helix transcriptional regulator [Hathewaya massiliensis]
MQQKVNIKKYREKKTLSQNKLAKKIGVSQSYLSAIEREEKSPTIRMLFKIAHELNVCPRLLIRCTIECKYCTKKYKCLCDLGDK